jgi:Ca2+-binding RTX toxin-like protein
MPPSTPGLGGGGVTFEGAGGHDSLTGIAGVDERRSAGDDDRIDAGADHNWLRGDRTLWMAGDATTGNDSLYAGAGNDWLFGDAGDDSLCGGDDHSSLQGDAWGEAGADSLDGGAGRDRLTLLDDLSVPVFTVDLSRGTITGHGGDTIAGIGVILGSYESSTRITGNGAASGLLEGRHRLWRRGRGQPLGRLGPRPPPRRQRPRRPLRRRRARHLLGRHGPRRLLLD